MVKLLKKKKTEKKVEKKIEKVEKEEELTGSAKIARAEAHFAKSISERILKVTKSYSRKLKFYGSPFKAQSLEAYSCDPIKMRANAPITQHN